MLATDIQDLPELRVARVRYVGAFCDPAGSTGARRFSGPGVRVLGVPHEEPNALPVEIRIAIHVPPR